MAIIKNYGLRWSRDKVDWGARGPGKGGTLFGKYGTANSEDVVDFRDQIGVYVLYDKDFDPVYIGQAGKQWQNEPQQHRRSRSPR